MNAQPTISGTINAYAQVTAIDQGCPPTLALDNATPFTAGDKVLLIQMKGAAIDTDNSAAFGDITDLGNAGNLEFNRIATVTGNEVTLQHVLVNAYDVPGGVQLVRVPEYTDVTISGTITCAPWNGSTGGVVVLHATGTVQMNADINVSSSGFRPGSTNLNGPYTCSQMDYSYPFNSVNGGRKGEGIHALLPVMENGRGKNTHGGGGGNNTNAGGGGAGNGGIGGRGGNQWSPGCPDIAIGGDPGTALPYDPMMGKVFLGGGGGGGHQNDNIGTPGTAGGGMVLLVCDVLAANGTAVQAQALDAGLTLGDGAGGGGSGGTVLLQVGMISGNLTIDAHGGSGGNVSSTDVHGPGGGGGGGVLWTSMPPGPNVTTILNGGSPGNYVQNGSNHGAEAGLPGIALSGFSVQEGAPADFDVALETTNAGCDGGLGGSILVVPSGGTAPYDISWDAPLIGASFTVTDIGAGSYTFTATDAAGCENSQTVTVQSTPTFDLDIGPDTLLCGTVDLVLSSGYPAANSTWQDGSQASTYQVTAPGSYSVVVDFNGCVGTASVVVSSSALPVLQLQDDVLHCDTAIVSLSAVAGPGDIITWQDGSTGPVFLATLPGTYVATSSNPCGAVVDSVNVSLSPGLEAPDRMQICPGEQAELDWTGSVTAVLWSTGASTFTVELPEGIHTYAATDLSGCSRTGTITVYSDPEADGVSFAPNVFTPEGDGINDLFHVVGAERDGFLLEIYNRWGELLFSSIDPQRGWDGRYNGSDIPDGTYVYVLSHRSNCGNRGLTTKVGHVSVLR